MRISGNSAAKADNPLIAQIEQRIKRLEKQKERLMQQLTGSQSSPTQTQSVGPKQTAVSVGGSKAGTTEAPAAVATPAPVKTPSSEPGKAAPVASSPKLSTPSSSPSQSMADLTQSLQSLQAAGGGGGGGDMGGGLEALMEKIQLIDMQIMTLRQQMTSTQMTDDMMEMAVTATEDAGEGAEGLLPAPAADENGHVDGYV